MLHLRKILRKNYPLFKNKVKIIQQNNKIEEIMRDSNNISISSTFYFAFLNNGGL